MAMHLLVDQCTTNERCVINVRGSLPHYDDEHKINRLLQQK